MKKIVMAALCLAAVGGMTAQKQVVDQAAKMSGKASQLNEARTLIKQAMGNPETQNDARTYFVAGKLEFDAFDNAVKAAAVNPGAPEANPSDMGMELINGYKYFLQALPLDQQPDEKGKVKPKHTKDIISKIAGHANDYFTMGGQFYNNKQYYPQAYEAFMIYGDLPEQEFMGKNAPQIPDTVRGTSYFNAGLAAYSGNEVMKSAEAFKKARKVGYNDPQAYIFEIACWQALEQRDSTMMDAAKKNIIAVAEDGYGKFGLSNPIFFNNLVNYKVSDNQFDEAISMINNALQSNPESGNLYGLRGFVYDRANKDAESLADYRKAAEIANTDFETLRNAAKKVFRVGQEKWNLIEGNDPAGRQDIKVNYFEAAKKIADRARAMNPNDSDLNRVIENIDYALDTYFTK